MKLRDFLKTVPALGTVLALPAKAEPRYEIAMDWCSDGPKSSFRGWEVQHDMVADIVTIRTVERSDNGDYMSASRIIDRGSCGAPMEVNRLSHECERWTCRIGENPLYPHA